MDTYPADKHRNLFVTVVLIIVTIFLPLIGHILLTFMIANDYMTLTEKIIWLVVIWSLPFIGPLIYLLVGQRRNRLFGGRALI